jgi:NADH-quinone oxidoreductase subunit J
MFVTILFVVFALIAIGGALGVVLSRNPVHSALWLVATLLSIAGFFVLQHAYLLSAVQVIVYASAIVVLFLFVIMLLGVDREESLGDPLRIQRPIAIGLGLIVFALILGLMGNHWATGAVTATGPLTAGGGGGNVEHVARALFTTYLWPFELTSMLLVVGVVGGVALARRSNAEEEESA